jgi:hypothetical protein
VLARRLEVTDPASIAQVAAHLDRRYGRLDVLVNNAAIHYDTWQHASTADLPIVREALEVNLVGAWQTSLTLLPLLRASGHGRIVNVSSEAGSLASMDGGTPAYNVSKAALNTLTRMLPATCPATGSWSLPSARAGWPPTWAAPADARWPTARPASCGPSTCPMTGPLAASTATAARFPGDAGQYRGAAHRMGHQGGLMAAGQVGWMPR